jgi:hypothetical protein
MTPASPRTTFMNTALHAHARSGSTPEHMGPLDSSHTRAGGSGLRLWITVIVLTLFLLPGVSRAGEPPFPPADIIPDSNMAGVIGDVVESAKPDSTVKHFVTPKKSTELDQEYVILKVTGISADQITPGHANQIVEWEGGEAVPSQPLKRRVKRDATGTGPTEVSGVSSLGFTSALRMTGRVSPRISISRTKTFEYLDRPLPCQPGPFDSTAASCVTLRAARPESRPAPERLRMKSSGVFFRFFQRAWVHRSIRAAKSRRNSSRHWLTVFAPW